MNKKELEEHRRLLIDLNKEKDIQIKELQTKIDKAIDWCDEIIRTFCEDDKQVVVAYEIKEILGDKEIEEIPLFEGTLEQLNNLSIIGDKENE